MKIYIDNDYKCHIANDGTMREFDVLFFDGKCKRFIEGYRFIPDGETWVREDGKVFSGEMIAPFIDYTLLSAYQEQYEEMLAEQMDMKAALEVLEVEE